MIIRLIIDISQVKSGVFSRVRFDWVLIDGLPIDGSHRSRTFSASPIYYKIQKCPEHISRYFWARPVQHADL